MLKRITILSVRMLMYLNLTLLAIFVLLYSVTSKWLERTPVNGAVVFTGFGLVFGPTCLGLLNLDVNWESLKLTAELTLAIVLFSDAAKVHFRVLKPNISLPVRLLLVALPVTILLGFLFGIVVLDGLTLIETAILATMLAPTDAALGEAVVTDELVPTRIRESLNVESGLNDGICVPILFVFLALATGDNGEATTSMLAFKLVAEEIGIGLAMGICITSLGVGLLKVGQKFDLITEDWFQLPVVALAIACFAAAQTFGGSGFIAAFSGGLVFGRLEKKQKKDLLLAAEASGDTFSLITWVIFGAGVVGQSFNHLNWQVLLYAMLSLTIIRMIPTFLALTGTTLRPNEKLFMGWFGPRGLASIVFCVIVLNENLPGRETITIAVICTVILSIIFHGISAHPLIGALAGKNRLSGDLPNAPDSK